MCYEHVEKHEHLSSEAVLSWYSGDIIPDFRSTLDLAFENHFTETGFCPEAAGSRREYLDKAPPV